MIAGSTQDITSLLNATNTTSFLEAYQKLKSPLSLKELSTKALDGPNKGVSVFWWLIAAAADGRPEAFDAVWIKFKQDINIDNLRCKADDGPYKGRSALWMLALIAANGHPEAFDAVWDKFKNEITIDDLRLKAEGGPDRGLSVLWILAAATANRHPKAFDAVWNKFKNDITIDDLRIKAEEGPNKGKSALWMLASAATNGHPEAFDAVWDKFKHNLTLDDLRIKAEDELNREKSALWLLAAAAANSHPQSLKAVWDKFKNIISIDDLRSKPEEGPCQGKSVLWLITYGLLKKHQLSLNDTFREILAQIPSILNDQELAENPAGSPSIAELISQHPDVSWRESTLHLIAARNTLFATIKIQQEETLLEEQDIKALSDLAKKATGAGYLNAFYDIGLLFFEKNNLQAACTAFQELPPNAKQFTTANSQAANTLLGEAMNEKNDNERHEHLKAALWFALRSNNFEEKMRLLQKIAYCHVTKGVGIDLGTVNFMEENILLCLNDSAPLPNYFELFEKLYKFAKQESALQKSMTKEEKKSPPLESLPIHYTPGFTSSSLGQSNPTKTGKRARKITIHKHDNF